MTPAVAIFTGKGTETILEIGGTQSWVLDPGRARQAEYAVLFFNEGAPWSTPHFAPHRSSFFLGEIDDVVPSTDHEGRWKISFRRYAVLPPHASIWQKWRNPVRYTTLEALGIDLNGIELLAMPAGSSGPRPRVEERKESGISMDEAKLLLGRYYRVPPTSVEIVIRG